MNWDVPPPAAFMGRLGPPPATPPPEIGQMVRGLRVLHPEKEVKIIPSQFSPCGWAVRIAKNKKLPSKIKKLVKTLQAFRPWAEVKAIRGSWGSDEWAVDVDGLVVLPPSDDDAPSAFNDKDDDDDPMEVAAYLADRFVVIQTCVYDRETDQAVTDSNGKILWDMPPNVRVAFDKYKEICVANDTNIGVCAKCGKISGRLRSVTVCTCRDGTKIYWCRKCCDKWDDGVEGPESRDFLMSLRTLTLRALEYDSYVP